MKYKTDCWILNELLVPHNKASKRVCLNQSAFKTAICCKTLNNFQMSIILNIAIDYTVYIYSTINVKIIKISASSGQVFQYNEVEI